MERLGSPVMRWASTTVSWPKTGGLGDEVVVEVAAREVDGRGAAEALGDPSWAGTAATSPTPKAITHAPVSLRRSVMRILRPPAFSPPGSQARDRRGEHSSRVSARGKSRGIEVGAVREGPRTARLGLAQQAGPAGQLQGQALVGVGEVGPEQGSDPGQAAGDGVAVQVEGPCRADCRALLVQVGLEGEYG